ncbi:esterase/lipase family protein [Streptomyces mirabilis]|uniref:esterase/lipase family protein n=1 Tax=Streptomyces mirabilis TaxID=68239 RepID=UPI00379ABDCB
MVVVPGIMGSELVDAASGKVLWGLKPGALSQLWDRSGALAGLCVTEEERAGETNRVRASQLLRFPAWAPVLHGFEPYRALTASIGQAVAAPSAVLKFPYDWRLPVEYNGRLLAEAARRHLQTWIAAVRATPTLRRREDREPQLVFVAHSMGGLVTRAALAHHRDLLPDTRAVVTLGTPFLGSAKAAVMLNGGRRLSHGPVASRVLDCLQSLTITLPGVHDLLPDYRCVDEGLEVARITPERVSALGGDGELARISSEFQARMRSDDGVILPGHRAVVGVAQPTVQSIRVTEGVVHPQHDAFLTYPDGELRRDANGIPERRDRAGDGTVYRDAARGGVSKPVYLPVQHGALAKDETVLRYVNAVLTEYDDQVGPPMGRGELGMSLPEAGVIAGVSWTLLVTGRTSSAGVGCRLVDANTGRQIARVQMAAREGALTATVTIPKPGLYRIEAQAGGGTPVTQLLVAHAPDAAAGDS